MAMSDNRTTELLREGLTERGIKWRSGLKGVTIVGDWCFVEYDNGKLAATCEAVLTPEQAIAATMGGGECELTYGETDEGVDSWFTQCGGRFNATFEDRHMVHPKFCQLCGRRAVKR